VIWQGTELSNWHVEHDALVHHWLHVDSSDLVSLLGSVDAQKGGLSSNSERSLQNIH